jgi:hypothetical protein
MPIAPTPSRRAPGRPPSLNLPAGNPVTVARDKLGLSKAAFARRYGISYRQLVNAEGGYVRVIGPDVLRALDELGVDAEVAGAEHAAWLERLRVGGKADAP